MSRVLLVAGLVLAVFLVVAVLAVRAREQAEARMREARSEALLQRARAEERLEDGSAPRAASPQDADLAAELGRVRASLERIEARLGALERVPVAPGGPAPESASADEQLRILRDLQESVALLMALQEDPELGLQRPREARPEPDWSALGALLSLWETDVEQARKEVQLLSEAEVLRRYSTPDLTFSRGEGTRWVYGQGYVPARDAYELQLTFEIRHGLVRQFFVERL